jgi:Tfp pilus assembly protein PilV
MKIPALSRQKGMVLIIVIVAIMLMSVIVVGILSRNISSSLGDENEMKRFQAELLAKGGFWRLYQNGGVPPASFTVDSLGTTYRVSYVTGAPGPSGTSQIVVQVDY